MRVLIIGATGAIGSLVADTLESRDHEVIRASRHSEVTVDLGDPDSVRSLFEQVGSVDAVVVAFGPTPYKPVTELDRDDFTAAFNSKALGQLGVAIEALKHVNDGGSITLTSGVTARTPIATCAAAAFVNGGLESFMITAAAEAPRSIRVNAVSPDVLERSPQFYSSFTGHRPVSDEEVGRAYVLAVEGIVNGQIIKVGDQY